MSGKNWFIDEYDRPLYRKWRLGLRGPYTKREAADLTGTDYSYMKTDGLPCFTPDSPCKHPPTRIYSWIVEGKIGTGCCDCRKVLRG